MQDRKLAVRTADHIERRIIAGEWPVGSMIGSESQLLKEYGVSRAVLREAILILEQRQIARRQRGLGGGVMACSPTVSSVARTMALFLEFNDVGVDDLMETRILLEGHCAAKAARSASPAAIKELKDYAQAGLAMSGAEARSHMGHFHVLLAKLAGNPVWSLVTEALIDVAAGLLERRGRMPTDSEIRAQFKLLVLVAEEIENRDETAARDQVRKFIEKVQKYYHDGLNSNTGKTPARRRRKA